MSYILIPPTNNNEDIFFLFSNKNIKNINNINNIYISESLFNYLNNIKENINLYLKEWDFYKKITNPYEYIHTHILFKNFSVSKYKPLSRSFFKMIEIINVFELLKESTSIKSFHLAEGPGGFIEAFNYYRNNNIDNYYGITLISNNQNVPSWKKAENYIKNNKNIILEYGETKNGDLFSFKNLSYFHKKYSESMDYITADGGFDFSTDFNNQEDLSFKLIITQIFYAILIQKKGGNFILKIFDIFKYKTVEIIYLLSKLYTSVYIYKPSTSRIANSEKYLICKNFKNNCNDFKNQIIEKFNYIIRNVNNFESLFNFTFSKIFIYKIKEINAIYGQNQLENIYFTLNIIKEIYNLNLQIHDNKNILDIESENFFLKNIDSLLIIKENLDFSNNKIINNKINENNNNNNNIIFIDDEKINKNINTINNKLIILKSINIQKCINWCIKYNIDINKYFTL